jgi:hypothetical protein
MEPNSVIHIVGLSCRSDQEEKFNKWYNERHIPDLLKFKGVRRVTRYKILTPNRRYPGYPDVKYPNYLAIYEFENQEVFEAYEASRELAETKKEVSKTWAEDAFEQVWRVEYKALKTWKQ